jgi:hypothetical protein
VATVLTVNVLFGFDNNDTITHNFFYLRGPNDQGIDIEGRMVGVKFLI